MARRFQEFRQADDRRRLTRHWSVADPVHFHALVLDGAYAQAEDGELLFRARPPIATERLELTPDGNVRYHFRKPWRNGTAYVDYSPLELIERLAVLVPAPRGHLLVYHGLLAPNAARRARIVPEPAEPESPVAQCPESAT